MIELKSLVSTLDNYLDVSSIPDYCPNGLQVEGGAEIRKIITGVTASQRLLDIASERNADAVLVHHGYFWKGESSVIAGMKKRRLKTLLANDISLLAYHLPLDVHAQVGNNIQLAKRLEVKVDGPLKQERYGALGLVGHFSETMSVQSVSDLLQRELQREPVVIAAEDRPIRSVAWCTGAAQGFIESAIEAGVDLYISGEISEPTVHAARECGIHYMSAGHHATERYGVKALGEWIAENYDVEVEFVDIDNPV